MKYFAVEPEVAGGWGARTVVTRVPGRPPSVERLHYEFDGWLGDELLESSPCFIATERLAKEIAGAQLTGVAFDDVEVTTSSQFQELHAGRQLPKFVWLKITGEPERDDFGLERLRLVMSERAIQLVQGRMAHALVRAR